MSDPRPSGTVVKAPRHDSSGDLPASSPFEHALDVSHLTPGDVLWTLSHDGSTAQARRWTTPSGLELEMAMWSGERVPGQEDLCWSQLFSSDEALMRAAQAKKRQLESAGWLEDLDTAAVRS